jgi:hypothetical protein
VKGILILWDYVCIDMRNNFLDDCIQGEKFAQIGANDGIYYRHTHEVNDFFMNPPSEPFVLVSHNSDGKITKDPGEYDADVGLMPCNLIRWYGQNVSVINDRIESIPIGLENSHWFKRERKINKMIDIVKTNRRIENLVYLNLNIKTNPAVRQPIYDILNDRPYVTIEHGKNGKGYDNYLKNMYSHGFMVCPEGNGIDTHRTWESLYVGTIPICKKNINNKNWRELPVCWVDDWLELRSEDFLFNELVRLRRGKRDLSKLTFSYWKNKILCTT